MIVLDYALDLDELLGRGHIDCEMTHADTQCSVEVTHLAIDCKKSRMVCATAAASIRDRIEKAVTCLHCMRYGRDCWRLVPV